MADSFSNTVASGSLPPLAELRDEPALLLLGHDLRATLSEVIGGLRLIKPERLDAKTRQQIASARAAGEALALLLEQALAVLLNQDGAGTAAGVVMTDRLQEDLAQRWPPQFAAKGLNFALNFAPDLPRVLPLAPAKLERLLANLLGNALKHSHFAGDAGHVTCRMWTESDDVLCIEVADTGIGFPEPVAQKLAESMEQANLQGGLGLRIVHDLVQDMGGTYTAQNQPDGGALVRLRLPLAQTQPYTNTAATDLSGLTILVADDNATNRDVLTQFLGRHGAKVVTVDNGAAALRHAADTRFDLLILDIEMPGMSGLQVIRALRTSFGAIAAMPILAVTAYTLRTNRMAILDAGANGILSKPVICAEDLARMVRQTVGVRPLVSNFLMADDIDPGPLLHLLDIAGPYGANELSNQLLEDLRAVERALFPASTAPTPADWALLRAQSHVLISLAGVTGAKRLQALAETLNDQAHLQDPTQNIRALLQDIMQGLDALINFVARQAAQKAVAQ